MTVLEPSRQHSFSLNVVANYAGKFWSIASVYIFVPVYIRILGIDAYGLIAFNSITLALLFIADAGLSSAFAREAAKKQRGQKLLDVLTSVERVLFGILIVVGSAFAVLAPMIADNWLDSLQVLDRHVVVQSLQLMPLALVPQIAMSLYFGGLMGLERQVTANLLFTAFTVLRSGCVIIPIYFIPDVRMFFAWQAITSIVLLLIMRSTLHRYICFGERHAPNFTPALRGRFSVTSLQQIRSYALGMLGMSIVAGLNTQIDKLVVSKMLPLAEFAQYSLVSTLAQVPYILTLPIATALLPRFTNLLETGRSVELTRLYRSSTYYIATVGTIAGLALCLFVGDVMTLWVQGQPINEMTVKAARLLAVGCTLLTFQLAPFQLSLAHGHNRTNVRLGVTVLLVSVPLQLFLTSRYGVLGAALPWLLMNAAAFLYLGISLNSRFLVATPRLYFMNDTLPPVVVGAVVLGAARMLADAFDAGALSNCIVAALASLVALGFAHAMRRRNSTSDLEHP